MTLRPRLLLDRLRASLWVVPLGLVLGMILLCELLLALDARYPIELRLMSGAGIAGARDMLQAVASSMITVAGLVFSLTLAVLSQASAQYSSRVLRAFLRDRVNQTVLGVFLGIYAYCLVALRGLGVDDSAMPTLTVIGGLLAAFVGIVYLIYFIHHIAASLQVENILAAIEADTRPVLQRLYPDDCEPAAEPEVMPTRPDDAIAIPAPCSGYLTDANFTALTDIATTLDGVVYVPHRVGDFVPAGYPLAWLARTTRPDDTVLAQLRDAFSQGPQRSLQQDASFGIRQLVDVALKALSPGVNDTTNAIMVLDRLHSLLSVVVARPFPSALRHVDGELRLVGTRPDFESLLGLALDQIRQWGANNPAVLAHMLRILGELRLRACSAERAALLQQYARRVLETAERDVPERLDQEWIRQHASIALGDTDSMSSPAHRARPTWTP